MKKVICLIMVVMFIASGFFGYSAKAAENEVEIPTFKVKKINGGTGVKIIINKTKGADGYFIYISDTDNDYSQYMYDDGKYIRLVGDLKKDGTKKHTYKINGLTKGKYTFIVAAYQLDPYGYADRNIIYGKEKTIKIKAAKAKEKKKTYYDFSKANVGDIIEFGSYEQDDNMKNGKEAIEWIVLSKDEDQMLVVSKYALDSLPYNKEKWTSTSWENSTLRKWLNEDFYKTAFSEDEKKMIKNTNLTNAPNTEYGTLGGNDTQDKVFLLSLDDINNVKYGFCSDYYELDVVRRCTPTVYAAVQGTYVYVTDDETYKAKDGGNTCCWWLRTPGFYDCDACYVNGCGNVNDAGDFVGDDEGYLVGGFYIYGRGYCVGRDDLAIRPALYISISM